MVFYKHFTLVASGLYLKRALKNLFWLCVLMACSALASAQIPGLRVYTNQHGYPGSTGYLIDQDHRGFIWIGTNNGVTRFDGQHFEVFDTEDGLANKEILMVVPGGDSSVMFLPLLNNLSYYHEGQVYTAADRKDLLQIAAQGQSKGMVDPATGTIWLFDSENSGAIYQFSHEESQRVPLQLDRPFMINRIYDEKLYLSLVGLKHGEYFEPVVYNLRTDSTHSITMANDEPLPGYSKDYWNAHGNQFIIHSQLRNIVEVFEMDAQYRLSKLASIPLGETKLKDIVIDRNNALWITYFGDGFEYYGTIDAQLNNRKPLSFLHEIDINYLFVDRDNNLWLSTRANGLLFVSAEHWACAVLNRQLGVPHYGPSRVVKGSNHQVFVSYARRSLLGQIRGQFRSKLYKDDEAGAGLQYLQSAPDGIVMATADSLYVGAIAAGQLKMGKGIILEGAIKDIDSLTDGSLLVATHAGVHSIDMARGQKQSMVFNKRASCVLGMANGSVLTGTPNGLLALRKVDDTWRLSNKPTDTSIYCTDLMLATRGHVMVGTNSMGIYMYDTAQQRLFKPKGLPERLGGACVHQIYRYQDTVFWLATDKGLFSLLLDASGSITHSAHYTASNGLPSNQVTSVCALKDTVYAATTGGLGIFPPESLSRLSKLGKLWVVKAQLEDTAIHFPKHISLVYPKSDIVLLLSTTLCYQNVERIVYQFRLREWGDRWVETTGSDVHLSYLPPGSHTVEIKAVSAENKATLSEVMFFEVNVFPAYWQTVWFKWLFGIGLLLVLFASVRLWMAFYKAKVQRKASQKKHLASLELEAIKAQINPHFIANCLNSIQYFHLKKQHERASRYLNLFARLIHLTMLYSKEAFISVSDEADYLMNYLQLENMRFNDALDCRVHIDAHLNPQEKIPAMLLQPYVENAIKHGLQVSAVKNGRIEVLFSKKDTGFLQVVVRDNGVGIKKTSGTKDRESLGLKLTQDRASVYEQLHQLKIRLEIHDLSEQCEQGSGTEIVLLIPTIPHA